ncbi:MAG: VIT1/CCC1 transporter family protein, partial [Deltaproteobacteria bacterium]|nr:VIT1/CCC1 transporter family protein [Deltaproteobacteria bacterium]
AAIVVILGLANLVADGFSMAVGNFLATQSERQLKEKARAMERKHIALVPEGEKEEIRQIFANKGFSGDILEKVVDIITADQKLWVETMLKEELGMAAETASPWKAALITFIAFFLLGALPLLPFLYEIVFAVRLPAAFFASAVMTGIAFFLVGAAKGRFTNVRWYYSGLKTLAIGAAAAVLAFGVGVLLQGLA